MWQVKRGNTSIQDIPIYQKDSTTLETNLAAVREITFQVKTSKTASAAVIEKLESAGGILVDTPSTGYVRITLSPEDTDIDIGMYVMGLQVDWSAASIYEVRIEIDDVETTEFEVEQDVVI